jgi:hypothetical protein
VAPGDHNPYQVLAGGPRLGSRWCPMRSAVLVRTWNARGILAAVQGVDGHKQTGDVYWYGVDLMTASQISDQSRTERTKAQDRTST